MEDLDPLTNLASRRELDRHLDTAISACRSRDEPLALILFDMDGFRRVNDRFGHLTGDIVLIEVASRLESACGSTGKAFRRGGEEFVLVFPGHSAQEGADRAALAQQKIADPIEVVSSDGQSRESLEVTASVGVATMPRDGTTGRELLRAADHDLYSTRQRRRGGGPQAGKLPEPRSLRLALRFVRDGRSLSFGRRKIRRSPSRRPPSGDESRARGPRACGAGGDPDPQAGS